MPQQRHPAPGTGETAAATAGATGAGVVLAGVVAFLVVLLWPRTSIISGAEEQRMLEEARRRSRSREATEPRVEPRATPREAPRTCITEYPAALRCDSLPASFIYSSPQVALQALKTSMRKSNLRLVSAKPSTGGPCPGVGKHYGVRDDGVYVASISCCPCCRDTLTGPVMTTLCRII